MTKAIPSIQKYMSTAPHTVGKDQTLAHAQELLHNFKIRHLPVLDGGQLVGMITQRDVAVIAGLKDVDPKKVLVEDAMSTEVFSVAPDAALDEVANEMAEKKYGSAVIVQNHKVVGIFTTVDLAMALTELLRSRLKS